MLFRSTKWFIKASALTITLCLFASSTMAQAGLGHAGDEDTILIEKEVSQKIPYHKILKQLSKRFLQFDADSAFTFGQGSRDSVVRNFKDFADRARYRVNVDKDEVELKFSLNF